MRRCFAAPVLKATMCLMIFSHGCSCVRLFRSTAFSKSPILVWANPPVRYLDKTCLTRMMYTSLVEILPSKTQH
ncbi:hypothetical protein BDV39DRAFT_174826 [Aspergillus sergii]|uniref:Secreted protein n=1 Tax=Aspergillus sergii TaxID=1034303 RepID=A0A5N6X799_9EURO|nr:hypothetical protein BDV39DRAFT_174826 [Aspergillus sergii]